MKLDIKAFHYLTNDDWRVLTAVESGSRNHEVVPTSLITQLSGLRTGSNSVNKCISTLAKASLIAKVKNAKYDGYRLAYGGLDYLALHSHTRSGAVVHMGNAMGVGKESDIRLVTTPNPLSRLDGNIAATPVQAILKIHRLGRTSFRSASNNRAYQGNRAHCTWQQLSRLSAQKEYTAMRSLYHAGFRVPTPVAQNRHTVVMSLIPGIPLRQVPLSAFGSNRKRRAERIAALYGECLELALSLAEVGVIHGDLNEFNILVENVPEPEDEDEEEQATYEEPDAELKEPLAEVIETSEDENDEDEKPLIPHLIDFPQITSLSHPNADDYFDRDILGIKAFFRKRYHFESEEADPTLADATARLESSKKPRLDVEIGAAGFNKRLAKELERHQRQVQNDEEDGIDDDVADDASIRDSNDVADDTMREDGSEAATESIVAGPAQMLDSAAIAKLNAQYDSVIAADLASQVDTMSFAGTQSMRPRTKKAVAGWSI